MIHIHGDGGHAKVVRDVMSFGYSYVENCVFVAVGDNKARKSEVEKAEGKKFLILSHPSAIVAA